MHIHEYRNWIIRNWARAGLIVSLFLFVCLFVFVKEKDFIVFLILLNTPIYMIHQTEEYVFPGGFQSFFNRQIFRVKSDKEPLTEIFIFWVNILYIWIVLPIFGLLSLKNYNFGIWIPYFSFFAGLSHIFLSVKAKTRYNPGLLVSVFINIPVGAGIIYYFYEHGIIDTIVLNFHCVIGLGLNLLLPFMGMIIYKRYKKKIG